MTAYKADMRRFILSVYYINDAGVVELADTPDLGSGGYPVQVQVLSPAPCRTLILVIGVCIFY